MTPLEDSPLAVTLPENASDLNRWYGTLSNVLDLLTTLAGHKVTASPHWPKSPAWFAIELRRITPQLRLHGILVNLSRCKNGRIVRIALDR